MACLRGAAVDATRASSVDGVVDAAGGPPERDDGLEEDCSGS